MTALLEPHLHDNLMVEHWKGGGIPRPGHGLSACPWYRMTRGMHVQTLVTG